MTDFAKEFKDLAGTYWGMDLRADWTAHSDGAEQWRIAAGDRYSREKFRQLAARAGTIVAPESADPIGAWLSFVREQPGTKIEPGPVCEACDAAGETTGIITIGSIDRVVQASELAAGNLPAPAVAEEDAPLSADDNPCNKAASKAASNEARRGKAEVKKKEKWEREQEIYDEFHDGNWKSQRAYIRKRLPGKNTGYLHDLIRRVEKRNSSEK